MGTLAFGSANAIMATLIAIVESDCSENKRIEQAMEMCGAYVANKKALHGIDARKRPTGDERRPNESEVAGVRQAIANREAALPNQSEMRRVFRAARLAIQLDARASNAVGEILKNELIADHR
jgi:hypothetical protein